MSGRSLYENKIREIKLVNQNILECNAKPKISGRTDYAIERRMLDIRHDQTFLDAEDYVGAENTQVKNPLFKNAVFVREHKCAFFKILLNVDVNGIYVPDEVKNDSKEYLHTADELISFVDDNYEKTEDDTRFIKVKDMYVLFKNTDLYTNLTKEEKRNTWNYTGFCDALKSTTKFKKYYRERYSKNGYNERRVLLNHLEMSGF